MEPNILRTLVITIKLIPQWLDKMKHDLQGISLEK